MPRDGCPEAAPSGPTPVALGACPDLRAVTRQGGGVLRVFVSTTGSAGRGNFGDPWTLAQALLAATRQKGSTGDTVWIRGGTYTGQFQCRLNGTPEKWITFRATRANAP